MTVKDKGLEKIVDRYMKKYNLYLPPWRFMQCDKKTFRNALKEERYYCTTLLEKAAMENYEREEDFTTGFLKRHGGPIEAELRGGILFLTKKKPSLFQRLRRWWKESGKYEDRGKIRELPTSGTIGWDNALLIGGVYESKT